MVNRNGPCTLVNDYAAERVYVDAIPGASLANLGGNQLKEGSVPMQEAFAQNAQGKRVGLAHSIKREAGLWEWINTCLENKPAGSATRQHKTLGIDHTILYFELPGAANRQTLLVEIAYTPEKEHRYALRGAQQTIQLTTPVCWVRSAHVKNSEITSFGTYRDIPIDMAFLVQKPCDYVAQTSTFMADRLAEGNNIALVNGKPDDSLMSVNG
jgi:hypothetical protein